MYALGFALLTLPYWIAFVIDLYFDVHLTHYAFGTFIKTMLPFALLCNVIGDIIAVVSLIKKRPGKRLSIAALVLNTLPLLGVGWILFWWTFIFRM